MPDGLSEIAKSVPEGTKRDRILDLCAGLFNEEVPDEVLEPIYAYADSIAPEAELRWDHAYGDAVQRRDWQECLRLLAERERADWWKERAPYA